MGNRQRKIIRAENNDPINFTCGLCKQVHEYKGSYDCVNVVTENEEQQEE
tara:strand:- start:335 stop:484 length:150 start_codon:yes stop_codon:yes gene_type:complete